MHRVRCSQPTTCEPNAVITPFLFQTNTFQLVLATDEVYSYAMFNYVNLQWTSHTEAGGDTTTGEGGVPAFVSIRVS
jgi:hypothetical protein